MIISMTTKKFSTLGKRDFCNGAILDEIAAALADREKLLRGDPVIVKDEDGNMMPSNFHTEAAKAIAAYQKEKPTAEETAKCPISLLDPLKFPCGIIVESESGDHSREPMHEGVTLRQWYIGMAISGVSAMRYSLLANGPKDIAQYAIAIADQVMEQMNAPPEVAKDRTCKN